MSATVLSQLKTVSNLFRGRPVLAIFEINMQCNSRCGYCDLPLNKGRYEMSREEIHGIFSKLYQDGIRYLFIQGGEPTLRKDLLEVLGDLHNIGFELSLITNGTRLTESFITQLRSLPVSISISLDSLDRDTYAQIRGADQLKLVLNGMRNLRDYPHPKYITCIVSEQNKKDAEDVVKYARQQGFIPVAGAYHWDVERYGKADAELQYKKEEAGLVFKQILSSGFVPRVYFRQYLLDNIAWLNGEKLSACDAGRYSISIDPAGNVAPCLALNHSGNLKESSLSAILESMNHDEIKSCSDASSCNMMCSRVVGSTLRHPVQALITPEHVNVLNH